MRRVPVLGVSVDCPSMTEAVDRARELMRSRGGAYAVTPNAEILLAAQSDPALRAALDGAALSLPDGIGVLLAARILGTPIPQRIPGVDFALALLERMAGEGRSVFLLGARPGVADEAARRLCRSCPGLRIAGTQNGYFSAAQEETLIERINAASPDLLMVCLGSPKQELWMRRSAARLRVGLMIGLGGTLDVLSGRVPRAPACWRRCGMEWLYRLLRQPSRLPRVTPLPRIVSAAILHRIRGV